MCEHVGISALTGKGIKGDDGPAIKEHFLFSNHAFLNYRYQQQ